MKSRKTGLHCEYMAGGAIRIGLFGLLVSLFLLLSVICQDVQGKEGPFARPRKVMVERQIKARGITDPRVLEVMGRVKRHLFVKKRLRRKAYNDYPLPIGEGQTISQPFVVALMTEALRLTPGDRVLEIGTGSGYQAAVLAEIAKEVFTVEIRKGLAEKAKERLKRLGYNNITVKEGDGYFGWEAKAPFDAIMVTAAANHIPPDLIKQLKEKGRLVIPVGSTRYWLTMTRITKVNGKPVVDYLEGGFSFVEMIGEMKKRGR